jgi:hypothetical protein
MREEEKWVPLPTFQRLPPLSDYAGPLGILFSKKFKQIGRFRLCNSVLLSMHAERFPCTM